MIRKLLFLALAGTLALTSCKNDDEDDLIINPPTPQDYSGIVLNEICGKQSPDDDWVELYNNGSTDVQLDGVYLEKTDEDGIVETIYTVPAGTTLKAGEYKVIATLSGELQAGISNSKQVGLELKSPSGQSIDKFDRDSDVGKDNSHVEGGSYARIPNGTGKWTITATATRGAANVGEELGPDTPQDYSHIRLNEICGAQEPDDDWVELYNDGTTDVQLDGVYLEKTDEDGIVETIYTVPAGTTLKAGEYKVIATLSGELQAGISNKKEVGLELKSPDGQSIDKFDRDSQIGTDVAHETNGSYARIPDGTGNWAVTTTATRGAENQLTQGSDQEEEGSTEKDYTGLVLNELNGNKPKYIELYNNNDTPLDISGVKIMKDDEDLAYVAPEGTVIPAKGFLTLPSDQTDYTTGFTTGLSAKKALKIELLTPNDQRIDLFENLPLNEGESWGDDPKYNADETGQSFGRYPDGTGSWYMTTATEDAANVAGTTAIQW